jgi:hypothetical protein
MRTEWTGNIMDVRAVEDSIRSTKKYTKGAFTSAEKHPIQGAAFPSRVLTEFYEVSPFIELSLNTSLKDCWNWLTNKTPTYQVLFRYDYRNNTGRVILKGTSEAVVNLCEGIPGFKDKIEVLDNGRAKKEQQTMGDTDRVGTRTITNP